MRSIAGLLCFMLLGGVVQAQNAYQKLGQKALIDGDFKLAVMNLEKAIAADSNNVNTLYMLGYSYYHASDYKQAINTLSRLISLRPNENSAYYYRGKARNMMAMDAKSLPTPEREKLLLAAVRDFSSAIQIDGEDIKLYQNRALAYRDYALLKADKTSKSYDKAKASDAFKACIADFQKVLDLSPARKDIMTQLEMAKANLQNLK